MTAPTKPPTAPSEAAKAHYYDRLVAGCKMLGIDVPQGATKTGSAKMSMLYFDAGFAACRERVLAEIDEETSHWRVDYRGPLNRLRRRIEEMK